MARTNREDLARRLAQSVPTRSIQIRDAFADAADTFWKQQIETDNWLCEPVGKIPGPVRAKLADLAVDLGRSTYLILDAHAEMLLGADEFAVFVDGKPVMDSIEAIQLALIRRRHSSAFLIGFKSFFFFLRAFQDAAWVCLRQVIDRVPLMVGVGAGRMSQAFKRQSPALAHLLSTIPDYQQWFLHWKALRDKVKGGVNFGFVTGDDPSVTFLATRDLPDSGGLAVGGQGDQVVRMSELTHALVQMTSLVRAIRSGPTVPR